MKTCSTPKPANPPSSSPSTVSFMSSPAVSNHTDPTDVFKTTQEDKYEVDEITFPAYNPTLVQEIRLKGLLLSQQQSIYLNVGVQCEVQNLRPAFQLFNLICCIWWCPTQWTTLTPILFMAILNCFQLCLVICKTELICQWLGYQRTFQSWNHFKWKLISSTRNIWRYYCK